MVATIPHPSAASTIAPGLRSRRPDQSSNQGDIPMQWIEPAYCDIRLGFEVTAYVYVR
jgi:pyrroloquinoline quinone biosynthesis protein A